MIVKGMTINDETTLVINYVYAHGQLEKDCGYDLVYIPKFRFNKLINGDL